jgi:ATP-dependent helicase/nuclease subunit A
MTRLADAGSRRIIEERLDLNLLVEAGAGSGKTHSLAGRMAAGIVSGRYQVTELAAVTFTRKAAAELRGRFQLALETRLSGAKGKERARVERALADLEHLFAGTIHSFCAHLLRERPVEAGVAPGFTELDDLADEEASQRAWRDYLVRLRGEQSPLLHDLQTARVKARDLDQAFRTVCNFDEVDFPPGDAPEPDLPSARKATDAFLDALRALMPTEPRPGSKCKLLDKARHFGRLLRGAGRANPAGLADAIRCWEKPPDITMKWWAEGREEQLLVRAKVQELVADFQSGVMGPFLSAWRQHVYRLVMTLLMGAREFAREQRRRALALNYGDLLWAAAVLLRRNGEVRAAMQRKYRWLLVDEFQDTDPLQAEVMLLLAADERGGDGVGRDGVVTDPYALRLREGALFVVGDPKQSIYRFRRADIDVYNRVRETITRNGGQVVPLTTSFRARPSLCQWNNEVFGRLLPADATVHQAAFSPLDPNPGWRAKREVQDGERGLLTLTIPADVVKKDVVVNDAGTIASHIRAEIDAGRATADDFLVLTRKKKSLAIYAAALEALHVPVEVSGAGAFGGSTLVQALVDLLRALGDPGDALAIVGVLRGPLFGISDRQLFDHRQAGGFFSIWAGPASDDQAPRPGDAAVNGALDRMGAFLRAARSMPLAGAVERILEETGFLALAASEDGGAGAGDLLHAVDIVREAAEAGGMLFDAAEALEQAAESTDIESVPLEPGRRDVVRVMNLHKAKGLEARVVFLADPLGGARKTADVRIVRTGGRASGYLAIAKEEFEYSRVLIAHPAGWDAHQQAEIAYVEAEESRLLYVAATRAREALVVSRWAGDGGAAGPWRALDGHLADASELEVGPVNAGRRRAAADVTPSARKAAAAARERQYERLTAPSWGVASVTEHRAAAETGDGAAADGAIEAARRVDAGPQFGTLVHDLLEHAAHHPAAARAELERVARWVCLEMPEIEEAIPSAVDAVERLTTSAFWSAVRSGSNVLAEVPFSILIPARRRFADLEPSATPTVLRGVIDLVYRASDGWRILDYKTDVSLAPGETLRDRHAPQLARYAAAWRQVTREEVAASGLVSARTGQVEWD